jgi:cation:H+ antiporter
MVLSIFLFCAGLALLHYGAEWLARGSSSLAKSLGVAPIVIGLTVVAFSAALPGLAA